MNKTTIAPYRKLALKVYGYTLPQLPTHKGYVKVGETTQPDVNKRVLQQTGTIGVQPNLVFERPALRSDNILFHDRDLHRYYRLREIKQVLNENRATEWFDFGDPALAEQMTDDYIRQDYDEVQVSDEKIDYILRAEQDEAVEATLDYWNHPIHGKEFLWNAKPRFGKTLTTYDFARKINAENVLIVTNRPAIANSWYDDFTKFIAWQEPGLKFVSETSALSERSPISRDEYLSYVIADSENKLNIRCLAFISLQDLKGARFAGGDFDKLAWVGDVEWNLLVIDEAHEGVDTIKTDRAFEKINRNFTLHLSGTPFKALATQKFHAQQIFNWSYLDEQQAKEQWEHNQPDTNPYAALPTMSLFTYQMSKMVEEHVARGIDIDEEKNVDYTFDLSEFFSTKDDGTFTYEADVIRFLDNLCAGKFPFAKTEHQQELNHTFWLLPRVASAKAMEKLLRAHPFFKDYEIVLAAGDGISLQDDETFEETEDFVKIEKRNAHSYDRLKKALKEFDKTITLTVSQLTTGVTIPEWTAVFILNNIKSPAMYFQAAFRAQNPYEFQNQETGEWYRKENSYVFDFAPDRTLVLFDEFANNLSDEGLTSTIDERKTNIRELINFFPVIAEDEDGSMTELSPEDVMTFPNRIKAAEVVKRGFMSNLLFVNISAIFAAPAEFKAILDKISPEKNKRLGDKREINLTDPMLNDKGEVEIDPKITINTHHDLFGPPIYRTDIEAVVEKIAEITDREKAARQVAQVVVGQLAEGFENTRAEFGLTRKAATQDAKKAENLLTTRVEESLFRREEKIRQADAAYEAEVQKQPTIHDREAVTEQYEARKQEIEAEFIADVKKSAEEVTLQVVETRLEKQEEVKKKTTEDDVRDHLRGFARTIPAFLMAYGSPETTLANYDKNIDPDTFLELTSITLGEFRMLRDGFEDTDANGITRTFKGLFNEGVFNASVAEFFRIKEKLADYLHTEEEEDIFDYIPPQRTNQIFTPKRVVKMMVDTLEEHDPQNFRNKETTFIDLYAKSGLYLTEVVKRLFRGLEEELPDEEERIKWILENQVYGCAPSNIIYNMVKNYVYAGYPQVSSANLLELDLTDAAKAGKVEDVLQERLGKKVKFDVIIGNPPYQESDGGAAASARPVYHLFIQEAKNLNPYYISFITPSRWFSGGKGLDSFRRDMLEDDRLRYLIDYPDSSNLFPNLEIKGGVNYFLWDRDYHGPSDISTIENNQLRSNRVRPLLIDGLDTFVRFNEAVSIIDKVKGLTEESFSELVSVRKPFGFSTDFSGYQKQKSSDNSIKIYANNEIGFINKMLIERNALWVDKFKVLISMAYGAGEGFPHQIINKPFIGEPGSCCTETYLVIGPLETKLETENAISYIKTRFFRFMVMLLKSTQHATKKVYKLVPLLDFSKPWTDEELYKKYNLDDEEIAFIESMIRPMD